jgi:serine phosphatase RsbU (regulator of sigma subunit)
MPTADASAETPASRWRRRVDGLRRRWRALPRSARLWWTAGLVLVVGERFFSIVAGGSCFAVLLTVLLWTWLVPSVLYALWWLWRKATYRVTVRLFVSYLLIGVLPFPLLLGIAAFALYVLIGQYASADFGDVMDGVDEALAALAAEAAAVAEDDGVEAAHGVLGRGPELPAELAGLTPFVDWMLLAGGETRRSAGAADLPPPAWMEKETDHGLYRHGEETLAAALARRGGNVAAVLVRLRPEAAGQLSEGRWYQAIFQDEGDDEDDEDDGDDDAREDEPQGAEDAPDADAPEDATAERSGRNVRAKVGDTVYDLTEGVATVGTRSLRSRAWNARSIFFIRVSPELRRWSDGSTIAGEQYGTFIRTSPAEATADFFRSPYEIREALWGVFLGLCAFFLFVYVGAVGLAVLQIWAITRSTARLTYGARQVQAGALDYRIPVRRRDQLGDLAVSFNRMTESVAGMLGEVAEKERLKGELELAREIQQSLLPARHLEHGSISVRAYFRPAAEVGGDYFDLFPLDHGRLLVAIGDVAGHGLSTGLLMAMVKSAVATLVQEGHRGPELLERVNQFMLRQPREHRMVTLALADVDAEARTVEITNAAHPPVFISGGTVREVMLPALPIGFQWRCRPPSERLELAPDSRLVFYSDGLVEALDGADEPFGYERLRASIEAQAAAGPEELMARLLADLERHTGGRPLDDDLTILIIDCGACAAV